MPTDLKQNKFGFNILAPGVYRLTQELENPQLDRRVTSDWTAMTFQPGLYKVEDGVESMIRATRSMRSIEVKKGRRVSADPTEEELAQIKELATPYITRVGRGARSESHHGLESGGGPFWEHTSKRSQRKWRDAWNALTSALVPEVPRNTYEGWRAPKAVYSVPGAETMIDLLLKHGFLDFDTLDRVLELRQEEREDKENEQK